MLLADLSITRQSGKMIRLFWEYSPRAGGDLSWAHSVSPYLQFTVHG